MVTDTNGFLSKAHPSIVMMLLGMDISFNLQSEKVPHGIVSHESGITAFTRLLQQAKTLLPIFFTELGITTDFMPE